MTDLQEEACQERRWCMDVLYWFFRQNWRVLNIIVYVQVHLKKLEYREKLHVFVTYLSETFIYILDSLHVK